MQTDYFPEVYNSQVDIRTDEKIHIARNQSTLRINSINQQHTKKPNGSGFASGSMIGFFGGFMACSCVCFSQGEDGFGTSVSIWVIFCVIGAVIGAVIDNNDQTFYDNNESTIAARIILEKDELDRQIKKIQSDAIREKQEYVPQFESNAQTMSVQFAESELAKEVINWMTDGFCKTIDSTDRGSHIEQINVPFIFYVFDSKITCNLGTYDFELMRCRNLNSPLEQTALARAIAAAIQLNIIMKYPKDASGTDVSIYIAYSYTRESPVATITYIAPNGNYRAVRGW